MARELYEKQEWEDLPSENTPISGERLGHIEQGIYDNSENMALKSFYGDDRISLGRSANSYVGNRSVAIGDSNIAADNYAIALGEQNLTLGVASITAGKENKTNGSYGVAMGSENSADGQCIALGRKNVVKNGSFAMGFNLVTAGNTQTVLGYNNISDASKAFIIGGGLPNDRKNIFTIDGQGNAAHTGTVESQGLILTDTMTGQKYKLTIANGNIEITAVE